MRTRLLGSWNKILLKTSNPHVQRWSVSHCVELATMAAWFNDTLLYHPCLSAYRELPSMNGAWF